MEKHSKEFQKLLKKLPINYQFAEPVDEKKSTGISVKGIPAVKKSYLQGGYTLLSPSEKPISKILTKTTLDE